MKELNYALAFEELQKIVGEMETGDISIDELQLLLSLSTHIRNKGSKISHTSTGKTMNDWDCFNRIQDKIWHFMGGSMDTLG